MAQFFWPDFWLVCASLLSITGGVYGLGYLMEIPDSRFNFFLTGAVTIVLANAVGLLLAFTAILLMDYAIWAIAIDYVHTTVADLALAQAYSNAFAGTLWLLSNRLQRSGMIARLNMDISISLHEYGHVGLILIIIVLLSQWYLLQHNIIVYGGNDLSTEGEPTHPLQALVGPLAPVLPFLLGYYIRKGVQAGRWMTVLIVGLLLLAELYWFFLFGRRSILHFFIFLLLSFSYGNVLTGRWLAKNIMPVMIGLFLILKVADTYHKLRTIYGFENLQRMSVIEGLAGLQQADDAPYAAIRKMNVTARSTYSLLALGQFINLFRTTKHHSLSGEVLKNSLLRATPSNFFVDKQSILAKEALYETAYSLNLTDISETLYLESFIDFGWYGFLIYAGFIYILFYGLYTLACLCRHPLFSLLVGCTSVSLAISMIETDMITVLATLRTVVLLGLIVRLFFKTTRNDSLSYKPSAGV